MKITIRYVVLFLIVILSFYSCKDKIYELDSNGFYKIKKDGTVLLSDNGRYSLMELSYGSGVWSFNGKFVLIVPQKINEIEVKAVEEKGFYNCFNIIEIRLPDSVENLGNYAFAGMRDLKEINIPSNLKKIGNYVFSGSNELETLEIPSSVSYIGKGAFYGLRSVSLAEGNSYYKIEEGCLLSLDGKRLVFVNTPLTSVENILSIPDGVEEVDEFSISLSSCSKIIIPVSVKHFSDYSVDIYDEDLTITYNGTVEQWKEISFEKNWYFGRADKVQCSDGEVQIKDQIKELT